MYFFVEFDVYSNVYLFFFFLMSINLGINELRNFEKELLNEWGKCYDLFVFGM